MAFLKQFIRYKSWADELFLGAVSSLTEDQLIAPQPIVFGSLIRTLNHSFLMDFVWKSNLLNVPHGLVDRNPECYPTLEELKNQQIEINQWYVDYVDSLKSDQLNQLIRFQFIGGGESELKRSEIITHVVNHATYHRGHAAFMLYDFGISPPTTDLPVYIKNLQKDAN